MEQLSVLVPFVTIHQTVNRNSVSILSKFLEESYHHFYQHAMSIETFLYHIQTLEQCGILYEFDKSLDHKICKLKTSYFMRGLLEFFFALHLNLFCAVKEEFQCSILHWDTCFMPFCQVLFTITAISCQSKSSLFIHIYTV